MKNWLFSLLICFGCLSAVNAQNTVRYGFCPENLTQEEAKAQGTGKNKFVAALICLNPTSDPALQRLKGQKIKGVRCNLRDDYKQAAQKRSYIMGCTGSQNNVTAKKFCNFNSGWNEILFDEPITIGDEKLYLGYQVYETVGAPYPLLVDGSVTIPGGCWVNLDRKGWEEKLDRGTLMIQAILNDEAAALLENTAYAQIAKQPLTVEPNSEFPAEVYMKNLSANPISSAQLTSLGEGDETPTVKTVKFEPALAPYDGRILPLKIKSGKKADTQQEIALNITEMDDKKAQEAMPGKTYLHVTRDAFLRIPLLEEFTSQMCPNCPFMIYYVDKARETYKEPLLYVTHHTGFQNDAFTLKNEDELCYLFTDGNKYNPAIMYDRLLLKGESNVALPSTGEPSHLPYLNRIEELAQRPAMAEILVDVDSTDSQVKCRVYGRINQEIAASKQPLYLTAYLVEDGLTLKDYPQQGLDVDDAPADLVSSFRHNGIIRHSFTKEIKGDLLTVADDATFSVDFPAVAWKKRWVHSNCQVIAFVHKRNEADPADNYVLNAGSDRYNHLITGVEEVLGESSVKVRFYVGSDRIVRTDVPVRQMQVYTISGASCSANSPLQPGIYVVRALTINGQVAVQKLLVR